MATLFNRTFTYYEVTKPVLQADGSYSDEEGASSRSVVGTVQPMTSEETISYLEGNRSTGSVKVYSSEQLATRTDEGDNVGYIRHAGNFYEIVTELVYQNGVQSHYKYIASMVPKSQYKGWMTA